MKEQLITFDTAKLAKEKGFDIHNYPFYYFYKGDKESNYIAINPKDIISFLTSEEGLLRPTQSLLQKWLREIHNIDVEPYLILCKHNNKEIPQHPEEKEYDYMLIVSGISQYIGTIQNNLSYEQALEKGLQEALKLIKL